MIRLPNLRQPSGARPRIDRTNPIARGLAYWTLPGFASPGQITVGTSFRTTPADGVVRGFGSTFGTGSTDSLEVPFNTHSTQRTFIVSCYLNGGGGGSLGRLFDKRVSGAQTEILFFNSSTNEINFGAARSVSAGQWVTSFSTGRRAVIAVTYDASSTANDPVIYIDGSPVTITETLTPNGTITTNTDNYVLGNRKNDNARNLDGWIGSFFVWDRILTPAEIAALARNPWQIFRPIVVPVKAPAGGATTYTATLSLSAAIQIAANATASIDAAVQTSQTASASLDVAVQRALSATASIDAAIQAAQAATASIDTAVQVSQSASASVDTAVQQARTATASVDTAVQTAGTASASVNTAVQAAGTATASVDAAVQASASASASLDVAVQAAQTIAASIDTVVQLARTTTASLDTAIQAAGMATASLNTYVQADGTVSASLNAAIQADQSTSASLDLAVQLARSAAASLDTVIALGQSATASLNAYIQAESAVTASLDAAIQAARSASASMDAAVQDARSAQIGLDAAVAVRQMLSAAMDVAVRAAVTGVVSLSAYVYDPDAVNLRDFMRDISSYAAPPGDVSAITTEQLSAVMLGSPIRVHPR